MQIRTFIIDAFTDQAFKGNPAGVCLLEQPISEADMQSIAAELNLSETAFLTGDIVNENKFTIRYFTPTVEIAFCGHATLASSKLVLQKLGRRNVNFTTHHGLKLSAATNGDEVVMQFPLYDTTAFEVNREFYAAFDIKEPLNTRYAQDVKMVLVEVADRAALEALRPNYIQALQVSSGLNNLIVTAPSTDGKYDFFSRCFCPWIGINEDPVTGASHCVLAKYWADKLGKKELTAYQASARGGFMKLKILGAGELEIRAHAKIVFEGLLNL